MREDRAKYLHNLDPNSAVYDPKSRSMKANPYMGTDKEAEYQGDNALKLSGDYLKLIENEAFMVEFNRQAKARGDDNFLINSVAMPSQFELVKKQVEENKRKMKE